eukprot:351285-Chlamydomonas_euryale.AAC.5
MHVLGVATDACARGCHRCMCSGLPPMQACIGVSRCGGMYSDAVPHARPPQTLHAERGDMACAPLSQRPPPAVPCAVSAPTCGAADERASCAASLCITVVLACYASLHVCNTHARCAVRMRSVWYACTVRSLHA